MVEIDTTPFEDLIEELVEVGIHPRPDHALPANCWVVYGPKAAKTILESGSTKYLKNVPEDPPLLDWQVPRGPLATIRGKPRRKHEDDCLSYYISYMKPVQRQFSGSTYFNVSDWISRMRGGGLFRQMMFKPGVIGMESQDFDILVLARMRGIPDSQGLLPVFRQILMAGGIRIGWKGEFPDAGEPVVFWPWDIPPTFEEN